MILKQIILFFIIVLIFHQILSAQETIQVKHTSNFEITGDGSASNWKTTPWINLTQRRTTGEKYQTKLKSLYSDSGIYCLFYCEDNKITATMKEDFLDLWNEDVVEAFLWPDTSSVIYFEYELSPLNFELPILVPNNKGNFLGWRPWHYEGNRKTKHRTRIHSKQNDSSKVTAWTAEFFIPYALMKPLQNVPPRKGTRWRANFYRVDYDKGISSWSWQPIRNTFHDYEKYGVLVFD